MNLLVQIRPKPADLQAIQWDGTYIGATKVLDAVRDLGIRTRFVPLGGPAVLLAAGPDGTVVELRADDWLILTGDGEIRTATTDQFHQLFETIPAPTTTEV
ncbi:hypothetical protein [Oerskovia jenensis]|uniref:hypothetical protein n=1 Tax=Oerskovia jenensis TaxID=162169 RepID=UPI0036DDF711